MSLKRKNGMMGKHFRPLIYKLYVTTFSAHPAVLKWQEGTAAILKWLKDGSWSHYVNSIRESVYMCESACVWGGGPRSWLTKSLWRELRDYHQNESAHSCVWHGSVCVRVYVYMCVCLFIVCLCDSLSWLCFQESMFVCRALYVWTWYATGYL